MRARAGKRICLTFLAACSVLWLTSVVRAQPTILSAVGEFDGGTSNQFVDVTFSQAMSSATAIDTANYAIAGYTITNAMFYTNGRGATSLNLVILQLGTQLTGDFTLSASNVQTSSGASIASNTVVAGTLDPLTSIDITSPSAATPSVWHTGTTFSKRRRRTWPSPTDRTYGTPRMASVTFTRPGQTTLPSSSKFIRYWVPPLGARLA